MQPILNIDLDGVVYQFHKSLASFIEMHGRTGPNGVLPGFEQPSIGDSYPEPEKWGFFEQWKMSEGEWTSWFRRSVENGHVWTKGEPVDGSVEYLWRLSDAGYFIRLVTTRLVHPFNHGFAVSATAKWLDKYNVPYRSLCFVGPGEKKSSFKGSLLLDDNLGNVRDFEENGSGFPVIFNQPWNADPSREYKDIRRVESWKAFYKLVLDELPIPTRTI